MSDVFSHAEVADLVDDLEVALRANDAFEYLVGELAALMEMAALYRSKGSYDAIAMIEYANKLQTTILASGHDSRVIQMCRTMLDLSGAREQEVVLGRDGIVKKRQVYFARRSDGLIKIGSSMNVRQRLVQLSTDAAEDLELLGHIDGSFLFEKKIHRHLADHCKQGEWFYSSNEVIEYIRDLVSIAQPAAAG